MNQSRVSALLKKKLHEKQPLIAVHRGCSGGNIIENTISAYRIALKYGGDILEVDVAKSTDGELYTIHQGQEERLFFTKENVETMTSEKLEQLQYKNENASSVKQKIEKLEDVLHYFKGGTLINLDRCWNFWDDVLEMVARHDMFDQILFKSPVSDKKLEKIEAYPVPVMFIPIVETKEELENVLHRSINVVAVEVLIPTLHSEFLNSEIIKSFKQQGLFIWLNAIKLNDERVLTAGSDDDIALLESEEQGWGRLIELGADIIQTDWPLHLSAYLAKQKQSEEECKDL